jgi:hypothetical protein
MLEKIKQEVDNKLRAQTISPRILLDRLNFLDDNSRKTSQYQDPNYFPFYYYLSKSLNSKTILQVGFDLALPLCCFLTGSPSTERVLAFQKKESSFYSPRIASLNIKKVRPSNFSVSFHFGSFLDKPFESMISSGFDLALITCKLKDDELNDILYLSWKYMKLDGFILVDHMKSNLKCFEVFKSFCKVQNRDFVLFETRYGNTLVRK